MDWTRTSFRWSAVVLVLLMSAAMLARPAAAQGVPAPTLRVAPASGEANQTLEPVAGLRRNSVETLEARGDSLWIGPCLNVTTDGGASFQIADTDRLCQASPNRLFSLDIEGDVLWAGLGRAAPGDVSATDGFLVSRDGGETFAYRLPQLDTGTEDTVRYGLNLLPSLPIVVPEESAPFAVDYVDSTDAVWVAGRASGLRRSTDDGETFERIVLPPDTLDFIRPDVPYAFALQPRRGNAGFFNHIVSSVLVDETGTVWAGTSAGVNRSRPEDVFTFQRPDGTTFDERAWRRFGFRNTDGANGNGLTGNFVTALAEQPFPGRNPVWMVTRPTNIDGEAQGVTVTRDGGQTFEQTLLRESVFDFAFRGATVYAAADRGLFISGDGGRSWRLLRGFPGADRPESAVATDLPVFAVATTDDALWAGTEDGLFKSTDGGRSWQAFRAQVPLSPEAPTEQVPEAETYAYPNPFSPVAAPSGVARIVVAVEEPRTVTVRLYDFSMDFVREVSEDCQPGANCEVAWDGTGEDGLRVANGVYFYEAETGEGNVRGKIMVLE